MVHRNIKIYKTSIRNGLKALEDNVIASKFAQCRSIDGKESAPSTGSTASKPRSAYLVKITAVRTEPSILDDE